MKSMTIIDDEFSFGGFTSGNEGIWTRNAPTDAPTDDYISLSERLRVPLTHIIRPYQASGDKVEIVGTEHGGMGVIKDNVLKKVDGIVTAEKGIALSVLAADCVPIYLIDKKAAVIGLLHCGWRSAAGSLLHNAVQRMKELGAVPAEIQVITGPHICPDCYEVGEDVRQAYAEVFTEKQLEKIFVIRNHKLYLDLSEAVRLKASSEGITDENISVINCCTCHDNSLYSYRRGDRGRQNAAFIIMKA
ncbi:polyphenol oxidase family protein [Ruminococcus flavefaciens]|uniref:polyphenol oxidase family protein n=1 Tax=Ruminococcus flavefaciens TaxID=1265 RepID=UPI0004B3ECF2|nr:polyphenol oxidase family protein [Ruminococcus flavefaciens]